LPPDADISLYAFAFVATPPRLLIICRCAALLSLVRRYAAAADAGFMSDTMPPVGDAAAVDATMPPPPLAGHCFLLLLDIDAAMPPRRFTLSASPDYGRLSRFRLRASFITPRYAAFRYAVVIADDAD